MRGMLEGKTTHGNRVRIGYNVMEFLKVLAVLLVKISF